MMLKQLFDAALPGIEALFAALGLLILAAARKWIADHAKNAEVNGILNRLADMVSTVVAEAEQTVVAGLKTRVHGKGSLTKEDAASVREGALAQLKAHLGPKGIEEIEKVLRPGNLNTLHISKIEAEVHAIRQEAA